MSKSERTFGRDCSVALMVGAQRVVTVSAIKSFEVTFMIDNPKGEYLGEAGVRYDYIYQGTEGNLKFDWDDDSTLQFYLQLVKAAGDRRRAVRLNCVSTFFFSTGVTARLQLPGCVFGKLPLSISERSRYVEGGFDIMCGGQPILL